MLTPTQLLITLMDEKAKAFSKDVLYLVQDLLNDNVTFTLYYGRDEVKVSEASTIEGKMTLFLIWVKAPRLFTIKTSHKDGDRQLDVEERLIWQESFNVYYLEEAIGEE